MSAKHYFEHVHLNSKFYIKTSKLPRLENQNPLPKDKPNLTKSFVQ